MISTRLCIHKEQTQPDPGSRCPRIQTRVGSNKAREWLIDNSEKDWQLLRGGRVSQGAAQVGLQGTTGCLLRGGQEKQGCVLPTSMYMCAHVIYTL